MTCLDMKCDDLYYGLTEVRMVSQEIKNARSALVQKRRQLSDELKKVDAAIQALDNVMGLSVPPKTPQAGVKDTISEILRDSRVPLHADAVLAQLRDRGVVISAADPKATVVTALIRLRNAGQVEALGKNVYRWRQPVDEADESHEEHVRRNVARIGQEGGGTELIPDSD